jgi:shikimate dehydrogenase
MAEHLKHNVPAEIRLEAWRGTYAVSSSADILVNATSIGLYPHVDAMPDVDLSGVNPGLLVCDAVFNPPETKLLRLARGNGLITLDGLSMLVYQGVIGFEIWTGQPAPEAVMKDALRQTLLGDAGTVETTRA